MDSLSSTPKILNLISFIFSIFGMPFNFTGKCILSYSTSSLCFLYFEIHSAVCLTGNRNAK